MNIGFIGFGAMAKAIAKGLIKENNHQLFASSPSLTQGVNKDGIHTYHNNKELIQQVDIIILAVKPNQMDEVIQEISPELPDSCLLISIAAGLTLKWFTRRFSKAHAFIRTMPNTPASVGLGATLLFANSLVNSKQKQAAEVIFSSVGITQWLNKEMEMDIFTALSGSGPAYVFYFMETLINAAMTLGLDYEIAHKFVLQTCKGAIKLAEESKLSLLELRTQVTSPGGTTAAALHILNPKLKQLIHSALQAARSRAEELGQLDEEK